MRRQWHIPPDAIARFVHGTTIATNAVLERKGARIGLITTAGFKDVLEIGRQMRRAMYDLVLQPETPVFLAPGAFRKEVPERIGPAGRGAGADRRDGGGAGRRRACGGGGRGGRGLLPVLVRQPGARAAHPRDHQPSASRADGVAVLRGRSGVSRIRADLRHRLRRLREAGGRPLSGSHGARSRRGRGRRAVADHAVARRRLLVFRGATSAGAAVSVGSGGGGGRRARSRASGRPRRSDHGRYRRHQLRCRAGQRRHAAEPGREYDRRLYRARAERRYHDDRRGRRQHRLARCRRRVAGRSGIGRLGAGPGLLRSRRRRGNGHRRLADPRLYRPGLFRRRLAEARAVPGARGRRADDRTAARNIGRGGGARDSPRPECPDVGGDPPRLDRPRHRSARLRAAAIGRRRPAARLRAGPRTRHNPHRRADSSWRALRRRPAVRADRARGIRRVPARPAGRLRGRKSGRRSTASMRPAAG